MPTPAATHPIPIPAPAVADRCDGEYSGGSTSVEDADGVVDGVSAVAVMEVAFADGEVITNGGDVTLARIAALLTLQDDTVAVDERVDALCTSPVPGSTNHRWSVSQLPSSLPIAKVLFPQSVRPTPPSKKSEGLHENWFRIHGFGLTHLKLMLSICPMTQQHTTASQQSKAEAHSKEGCFHIVRPRSSNCSCLVRRTGVLHLQDSCYYLELGCLFRCFSQKSLRALLKVRDVPLRA